MTNDHEAFLIPDTETDDEPHTSSPTAHVLDELALYGYRPCQDEPDPRPLPEADIGARARRHRRWLRRHAHGHPARRGPRRPAVVLRQLVPPQDRARRAQLDANEQAQRRWQLEQNGSEIRSVELEHLTAQGITLIERRDALEFCRDMRPSATRPTPARPGAPARARCSTIAP